MTQGPPPPTRYSPDGRWVWDGSQWQSVDEPVGNIEYATFGLRVWAYLIDSLLVGIPTLLLELLFVRGYYHLVISHQTIYYGNWINRLLLVNFFAAVVIGGYMVKFWTESGQTPGMRAVGIECVDAETGKPMAIESALIRSVFFWLPGLLGALTGVAFLGFVQLVAFVSVAVDPNRRGLHDKAAGSAVLMNRRPRHMTDGRVVLVGAGGSILAYGLFAILAAL